MSICLLCASLEKLFLCDLSSVRRVGNEFLGIEESTDYDGPSSCSSSSSSAVAFPKWKSLTIWYMDEMEEWEYRITRKENNFIMPRLSSLEIRGFPKLKTARLPPSDINTKEIGDLEVSLPLLEDHGTTDIPLLSSLEIHECPKLKVLPDYLLQTTTLQTLKILTCRILEERYREGEGDDWPKIFHIPHITGL